MDDDVVGDVAGGHEPFLAIEDEASVAPVGARADHAGIRTRLRFRHRDAGASLHRATRPEIGVDLFRRAVFQRDRGMGHDRPERPRRLAEFLTDHRQLELRTTLTADVLGVIDAIEAVLLHCPAQSIQGRGRQGTVQLELDLDERSSAR